MTKNTQPSETIHSKGLIFELIHKQQADGRVFEVARRSPGVRIIIADRTEKRVLLTKEFRQELDTWDYRLPGGKVFDSLEEYEAFLSAKGDIRAAAHKKAIAEGLEETGTDIINLDYIQKSTLGATIEWDLYVFEATDWRLSKTGQQLEPGEQINADGWFSYGEVTEKIMSGEVHEERIALILLRWINRQESEV